MKSRKEFVKQGALAAAALIIAKPYSAIAGKGSFFEYFSGNEDKFILNYSGKGIMHPNKKDYDLLYSTETDKDYSILVRNGVRTGFIHTDKNSSTDNINSISRQLKNEYQCRLVVCLSTMKDSIQLARKTDAVDMVICPKEKNASERALTTFNIENAEVIVHDIKSSSDACCSIEIKFDKQGNKRHVHH